jgi:hypothetical protein
MLNVTSLTAYNFILLDIMMLMYTDPKTKLILKIYENPKLNVPIMIFGVPDSGNVAKLVVEHLISELNAKPFLDIYSYGFPPQVVIRKNRTLELVKATMYYSKSKKDLILFTCDEQPAIPESAYIICEKVMSIAKSLGVKKVYAIGATITGTFTANPKVYATVNKDYLIREVLSEDVEIMNQGSITWMNGLIVGIARQLDIDGIFLSAETSGFIIDAKAAKVVLKKLLNMINVKVNLAKLDRRIKETNEILSEDSVRKNLQELGARIEPRTEFYK